MEKQYIENGIKYGYKKCCIDSFINKDFNDGNCGMFQATKKEGFIPCNTCYKKIVEDWLNTYQKNMYFGTYCNKGLAWNCYNSN
tara:strand:- start:481 stop:732 length:252 start_codon:yes stop_codon:yes gene_type:complete